MIDGAYMLVAFVVALGLLIVVHEFGHYWVARRMGVKVLRFSVGFGKPILTRRWGKHQTEFVVAAIPLGGYVRMLGEHDEDYTPEEAPLAFNRKSVGRRIAIVVAGPVFNLVFAVFAFWLVFLIGMEGLRPVVGGVAPASLAAQAGFQRGDELLTLDGKTVQTWSEHRMYLFRRALDRAEVVFTVRKENGAYMPEIPAIMGKIEPGPAQSAGLQVGDQIRSVEGRRVGNWQEFALAVRERPKLSTTLTVIRGGESLVITVVPRPEQVNGKTIGLIGVRPQLPELPDEM
ncbi:MAG: hypothetical protein AMS22_17215, partial [Thiotrichales bacterium SG8_50]